MKVPIHILYISYDGMTDPLGQSQVLPYLLGLEKLGYSFTLLSAEKKDAYQKNKDTIINLIKDKNINWEPIIYSKSPPIFSTIYDYVVLRNKSIDLYQKNKYQLVHCRSYISALVGVFLKRKIQTPFIFDMRGFWADERIDGNIWNLKNPVHQLVYKFFKAKEKEFLKLADAIICLTKKAKNEISTWKCLNNESSKITVIPCCVDTSFFNPNTINLELSFKRLQALGLKNDDLVLGYVGSIGTWYLLSEMLDFFKVLKIVKKEAKFLFITTEAPENILLPAHEKGLNKEDLLIVSGKRQEMPELISLIDFGIFFIKPVYSKMA
ncbi:MAG: glycosyltransferase, partial [Methylotenera sp.]|nr:glycosyltransferase [Flavobacterium sp.]